MFGFGDFQSKKYSKNIQKTGGFFRETVSGEIIVMTVIPQNQCERLLMRFLLQFSRACTGVGGFF